MTFRVSPGVDFLARIFAPLALLATVTSFIADWVDYPVSSSTLFIFFIFLLPFFATIYVSSTRFLHKRHAASLGARVAPELTGTLPGNLDFMLAMIRSLNDGYPGDGFTKLLAKHGPVINLKCLWEDIIFTASPNHIKTVLATDFRNYVKGEDFQHTMKSVLGTGVFNSDGDMWKFHRSLTRPFFTKEKIRHFELFDRRAQQAISKLKERLSEGYAVDFQDLVSRFTLDAATDFLFGKCVDSLSANLPYPHNAASPPLAEASHEDAANDFAKAFRKAQEIISFRQYAGWIWPLTELFEDKATKPMRLVNAFIEPIIKEALDRKQRMATPLSSKMKCEWLPQYPELYLTLPTFRLNILLAGRDTTAATLTFVVYFLAMYPTVLLRVRKEILDKVGPSRRPDYDDIKDMKYLRAVINETLRLYPIVPFNLRQSVKATTWEAETPNESPYFIPAGTCISYSVFLMQRRKDLWGPDAEEFDPDRFIDQRYERYLAKNPFIFLPFNAGPRICLGQQFAYNEVSFMLIRLLQNFVYVDLDLASAPPGSLPPPEWADATGRKAIEKFLPKIHLTMYANGGLWVKLTESGEPNNCH